MKKSILNFLKMFLLFKIIFSFTTLVFDNLLVECSNIFLNNRMYDLTYRYIQLFSFQLALIVMALFIVLLAIYRFFKLLLNYVLLEEIEESEVINREDKEIYWEEKKYIKSRFYNKVMAIILYLLIVIFLTVVIQSFNIVYRY